LSQLKNKFGRNEWSGALGDLGTMLPLAFALMVYNGFPPARLFFLWGVAYVVTGYFYKVPVSIQPLKAMSVIAIAGGFSPQQLSSTAVFYGALMVILALSGAIGFLQRLFSQALVRGVQLGIGFILAQKAIQLVLDRGLLIHYESLPIWWSVSLLLAAAFLLFRVQVKWQALLTLALIGVSIFVVKMFGFDPIEQMTSAPLQWTSPDFTFLLSALWLLMLPQLPLTLGNAVFAANDACHVLWGQQANRVTPKRLSLSIGLSDIFIGLLGGFPICHGAGGMGAHARFGARTGGATMILGGLFILCSLFPGAVSLLFYIPVPVLGALLLANSWQMVLLFTRLEQEEDMAVAILVGVVSFFTRNLTIALVAGFVLEKSIQFMLIKMKKEEII